MCGICGIVGFDVYEEAVDATLRMMQSMRHRGPDDEGMVCSRHAVFGMRRLSIVDLNNGRQPMFNEEGSIAVVFNGEIYNAEELRRELESLGHRFRTNSDTECLVHAYEQWREDCVSRLQGMFAFAALELDGADGWDARRICLARDRLGIKPLYYSLHAGILLFASELRSLLASGATSPSLSPRAVQSCLLFGSVHEPDTMFEGICCLPPGTTLTAAIQHCVIGIEQKRYWHLGGVLENGRNQSSKSREEAVQVLRSLLEDTIRMHLIADVPVGVFLSSGLDSSVLAALARRLDPGLQTLTLGFGDARLCEAAAARKIARRLGTHHQEWILSADDAPGAVIAAIKALDQPSMDGVNTHLVSGFASRAGLRVMLSGLGADEIFGGYPAFSRLPYLRRIMATVRFLPEPWQGVLVSGLNKAGSLTRYKDALAILASALKEPHVFPHPYYFTRLVFTPDHVSRLMHGFRGDTCPAASTYCFVEGGASIASLGDFEDTLLHEVQSYLLNTLLRDTDSVSMANSLEVRVPFLDHRLVEYAVSLPAGWQRRRRRRKAMLGDAVSDLLPRELVNGRKRPFALPWANWLRGPLQKQLEEGITDVPPSLRSLLSVGNACRVWKSYLEGRTGWARPWTLYVLNEWVRQAEMPVRLRSESFKQTVARSDYSESLEIRNRVV